MTEVVEEIAIVSGREVGVVRLNSHEWWIARDINEAVEGAVVHYGMRKSELIDESNPPYKMSEDKLWETHIGTQDGRVIPFKVELQERLDRGVSVPVLFGYSR